MILITDQRSISKSRQVVPWQITIASTSLAEGDKFDDPWGRHKNKHLLLIVLQLKIPKMCL